MSLDNLQYTGTPESRTYRVVLLLLVIGLVSAAGRGLWRLVVALPLNPTGLVLTIAAAAVVLAVWRYLRQFRR